MQSEIDLSRDQSRKIDSRVKVLLNIIFFLFLGNLDTKPQNKFRLVGGQSSKKRQNPTSSFNQIDHLSELLSILVNDQLIFTNYSSIAYFYSVNIELIDFQTNLCCSKMFI